MPPADSQTRFSDRVGDYVRHRPGYPAAVIDFLAANAGLAPGCAVADVGAGTGIFTRLLLDAGARVAAVEPNPEMRRAAEAALGTRAGFASVPGNAEATGLPPQSVDLATCAQAFHWFDPPAARREFLRILKPAGRCALIWNTPTTEGSAFARGYERIKSEFGTDLSHVRHENLPAPVFDVFFGPGRWKRHEFGNLQDLDLEGLKGRMRSSSYSPKEDHPRHGAMTAALEELFHRCQGGGLVRMEYRTELYLGRPG